MNAIALAILVIGAFWYDTQPWRGPEEKRAEEEKGKGIALTAIIIGSLTILFWISLRALYLGHSI